MSVSMVSESCFKSKKERIFNSRSNARKAWHCHRSWPKPHQTFFDIFALRCLLGDGLAGRIAVGDVASEGNKRDGNVTTGIPAKFVAAACSGSCRYTYLRLP